MLDLHHFMAYNKRVKNRRKKMIFGRKLLEVLIQIALLPLAAITTACTSILLTIIAAPLAYLGYVIEESILSWLKDYTAEEGVRYHVKPSDTVSITETFSGDYKVEVKHDDGVRYTMSGSEFGVWVLALFALPLRIITLLLSLLALIIPPLKIKAMNTYYSNIGSAIESNKQGTFWSIVFDIA